MTIRPEQRDLLTRWPHLWSPDWLKSYASWQQMVVNMPGRWDMYPNVVGAMLLMKLRLERKRRGA